MSADDEPQRPALKRHLRVVRIGRDHVLVMDEGDTQLLSGEALLAVLAQLDGARTVDEVALALAAEIDPAEVYYAVDRLAALGLLAAQHDDVPADVDACFQALGATPVAAPMAVELVGDVARDTVAARLAAAGFVERAGAPLVVALIGSYLAPALEGLDRRLRGEGRAWMLVKPEGRTLWIGPILHPERTACWQCLAFRLRLNSQAAELVARRRGTSGPPPIPRASGPATATLAASLSAVEIVRWLGGNRRLEGRLLSIDTLAGTSQEHAVVRRPQCPACGDPELQRTPRPVVLESVPKPYLERGSHRGLTAADTVERMRDQVSPITGVIRWLTSTEGAGHGVSYNVAAGHNFVMRPDDVEWLHRSMAVMTGGKGTTTEQAQASALGEAVERYSGVWRGEEHAVRASFAELAAGPVGALDPRASILFSERQYAEREAWNAGQGEGQRHVVTRPFDPAAVVDWTQVWSLTHDRPRLALSSYCYYGHPDATTHFFSTGDTNGCAAGNSLEEAIVQAFHELVERDAVAIWWYNRLRRPAVDLDDFDGPYLAQLRDYYRSIGREIWALDLTADLGIPTFAAISRAPGRPTEDVIYGFGAHLDPVAALTTAFSELNQFLPAVSRRDEDGASVYVWPEAEALAFWQAATVASDPYLLPDPAQPARRRADFATLHADDLRADVETCVELARRRGLEVFVLDQTRADIPMVVARVIVPGLRHFWRRLGPGRLYDVPVALGWLAAPTAEADLNPWSIFV